MNMFTDNNTSHLNVVVCFFLAADTNEVISGDGCSHQLKYNNMTVGGSALYFTVHGLFPIGVKQQLKKMQTCTHAENKWNVQ